MKKWTAIVAAVIIAIIVVIGFGLSNLGPIIEKTINNYGPKMTQTEVHVGDIDISLFSSKAILKDFYLGNPEGFKSPEAMKVDSVHIDVDRGSLRGDTMVINRIELISPAVTYEKVRGTDNFEKIVSNVRKASKSKGPSEKKAPEGDPGKKLIIRNFILRDGRVSLTMTALGEKRIEASLPHIHLKDIGNKDGISPEEAFQELLTALYRNFNAPEVTAVFKGRLKEMGLESKVLENRSDKETQLMVEQLKKLFGRKK